MSNTGAVGIFDSGIGGVTVLRELVSLLPYERFIYYGDSGNFPYGEKSAEKIRELSFGIVDFLLANGCKMIVIACNASTASALDALQKAFSVPVIGVIGNGAKAAAAKTRNKKICILATRFTVSNQAYVHALKAIDTSIEISQIACPHLASVIEDGWEATESQQELLSSYTSQIGRDVDTLVLGCTHYPLIEHDIAQRFPHTIINPAFETALQAKQILLDNALQNPNTTPHPNNVLFCVNADMNKIAEIARL